LEAVVQARLPQVDKLLRHSELEETLSQFRREIVVKVVRQTLEELRARSTCPQDAEIVALVKAHLAELASLSLKKVINGTGVVLNTNLGRAPIAQEHLEKLKEVAGGYCNLEINLETGKRGKRASALNKLLAVLAGAQASLAVNNNAAAVVLVVNCFALNKEVVVSRGELIEIGGSFRLPDVIEAAGGKLHEVGTTNKTRLADFERAISPETGLVLRCHRSNFELRGFTEETGLEELIKLCRARSVPLVEDLGSGVLMDLSELGLAGEPTVSEFLACGCDLVTFSGDKLLGGPQAGVIAGRKELVDKLAGHPLYRALRLDKLTICLLEQTLAAYLSSCPQASLPALKLISADFQQLSERIERFREKSAAVLKETKLELLLTSSATGGGSLPGKEKPSAGIILKTPWKATQVAQTLRQGSPPVITITKDNDNIIDFRTVLPGEEDLLLAALVQLENRLCHSDC
jgi:L-seryl-tRNA(Ser) seleniumtransferase